ncbi:MAG: hypothetical protein AAF773_21015, partial [Cyanobacteria bacterium P01_D01_bin.115]
MATQESNIETSDAESLLANTPPNSSDTFIPRPRRQCYQRNDDSLTTHLRLTIDSQSQSIQGDARSLVKDYEAGDSTSYAQSFSGKLADNQGEMRVLTWLNNDFQASDETWSFTDDMLEIGGHVLNLTDCQLVDPAFQDANGLEASDLISDLINDMAARLSESVQFDPGTSSITLNNSVLQGTQNVYYLRTQ